MRREAIPRVSQLVLKHLRENDLVTASLTDQAVLSVIEQVIAQNLKDEAAIEDQAKKLMDQHRSQMMSGTIDPHKAYLLVKSQIAKERKFVL